MWALSPLPSVLPPRLLQNSVNPPLLLRSSVSASSQSLRQGLFPPPGKGGVSSKETTIFAALDSDTFSSNQEKEDEGGEQISGSEVLWALQRAAAKKNKKTVPRKKQKKRGLSFVREGKREDEGSDYSNVRPLCMKREWGAKLDELEARLKELPDTA